jgi:hypothetical protein
MAVMFLVVLGYKKFAHCKLTGINGFLSPFFIFALGKGTTSSLNLSKYHVRTLERI